MESEYVTFNVVSDGQPMPGFTLQQAANNLARVMKTTPEKAEAIVLGYRVLKKGLTQEKAEAFRQKLESIGLSIQIQRVEPPSPSSGLSFELEPMDDEAPVEDQLQPSEAPQESAFITCPKCNIEQAKAEQCANCGIYFHKLPPVVPTESSPDPVSDPVPVPQTSASIASQDDSFVDDSYDDDDDEDDEGNSLQIAAFAAAAGAAVAGALLWKFIAVMFEYELGLVAWGIGGAVGFAAAALGSRGLQAGIVCGILVVASIMGGKYMAAGAFKEQAAEMILEMQGGADGLMPLYEEIMADSEVYAAEVTDDASLREFMVEYGYSEGWDYADVSDEEIEEFNESTGQELAGFAVNPPSYDEWVGGAFGEISEISTAGLMMEGFGILDVVFLFLGVGTAFRLASRYQAG